MLNRFVRLELKLRRSRKKIIEIRNIFQQNIMLSKFFIIQLPLCLFDVSSVSDIIL